MEALTLCVCEICHAVFRILEYDQEYDPALVCMAAKDQVTTASSGPVRIPSEYFVDCCRLWMHQARIVIIAVRIYAW